MVRSGKQPVIIHNRQFSKGALEDHTSVFLCDERVAYLHSDDEEDMQILKDGSILVVSRECCRACPRHRKL